MRPHWLRFSVRRLIAWVVAAAFAVLVIREICRICPSVPERVMAMILLIIAVSFGLEAMRHPVILFGVLVVLWFAIPQVYDSPWSNSLNVAAALGWYVGAPASLIFRRRMRDEIASPNAPGRGDAEQIQ